METNSRMNSKGYHPEAAVCKFGGSRPVNANGTYFCGFHKPMECGNQGAPINYAGLVIFTLYPCNARIGDGQPAVSKQAAAGGLELRLRPASSHTTMSPLINS